jgi:hypothetical protein
MADLETEIRQAFERRLAAMPARPDLRARISDVLQRKSAPQGWRVLAGSAALVLVAAVTFYILLARHVPPAPIIGPTPSGQLPTPTAAPTPAGGPATPGARLGAAMAWDQKDGYLLMFGGASYGPSGNVIYDDTWAWSGREWRQLKPAASPPGRTLGAMAFDPGSQRVLLFGGGSANSDPSRNDTWTWDGTTWTELRPADAPPKADAKMVYDPDLAGIVLVSPGGTTWTWIGSNWKQLHSSTSVTPRSDFGLAQVNGVGVVLVGGYVTPGPQGQRNDLWLFKGGNWRLQNQATRPIAGSCVVAYDAARRVLVLFSFGINQTWTWDGTTWKQQHPQHSPAAQLYFAAMGYDPATQEVVLFGGKTDSVSGSPVLDQTWIWNGSDWQQP